MTAIADKCTEIRLWLNQGIDEYPDSLVTTWVRGAEERFNAELRVDYMIQIDTAIATDGRVTLPGAWLEADFVRIVNGNPLVYKNRNDFHTIGVSGDYENKGKYTIIGRYIELGDASSVPPTVELSFYGQIPALDADPTWLSIYYPTLLLYGSLEHASLYGIEDERAATMKGKVGEMISQLNDMHKAAKTSGSRLSVKSKRSFG